MKNEFTPVAASRDYYQKVVDPVGGAHILPSSAWSVREYSQPHAQLENNPAPISNRGRGYVRHTPGRHAATWRGSHASGPAFQHAVDQFIEAELKLYPERATALGDHRFDARVDDDSATGIAQIVSHANRWTKIFHAFDANSLSLRDEADREWLLANIDAELLWTEGMRSYQPRRYIS